MQKQHMLKNKREKAVGRLCGQKLPVHVRLVISVVCTERLMTRTCSLQPALPCATHGAGFALGYQYSSRMPPKR